MILFRYLLILTGKMPDITANPESFRLRRWEWQPKSTRWDVARPQTRTGWGGRWVLSWNPSALADVFWKACRVNITPPHHHHHHHHRHVLLSPFSWDDFPGCGTRRQTWELGGDGEPGYPVNLVLLLQWYQGCYFSLYTPTAGKSLAKVRLRQFMNEDSWVKWSLMKFKGRK